MKKFLVIISLILSWCNISYANPKNPTNEWLENKTVNELTQKFGYKLFTVTADNNYTLYHLVNGKIVVACLVSQGNPKMKLYCFLP